jgi:hypothetical protein
MDTGNLRFKSKVPFFASSADAVGDTIAGRVRLVECP